MSMQKDLEDSPRFAGVTNFRSLGGLPAAGGVHFLLDTGTLSVLADYHGIPALKTWNAPVTGYVSPTAEEGTKVIGRMMR